MHVLIAGCGWLGRAIGTALIARGDRVTGARSSPASAAGLQAMGIEPLIVDLAGPEGASALPRDLDAIVACQSARSDGSGEYRRAYVDVNRALLGAARDLGVRVFVYTGSTGVFGQSDGGDVEETTTPEPSGGSGLVLLEAERLVLDGAVGGTVRSCVVRLSGLYGPDRAGILDRVRSGALALGAGDGNWMNFCHREDAAAVVLAALDHGRPGAVYHASDAHPATRRDVVMWIAARLGVEPAVVAGETTVPGIRRGANRRIRGERTRAELGTDLRYPSFREGLSALLPDAS